MAPHFHINTPTSVHFGVGVSQALKSVLPNPTDAVLMVRGKSETNSLPIKKDLEKHGVVVHQISVTSEPSVATVNSALDKVAGKECCAIIACGGGSVLDTAKALRFCLELGAKLPEDIATVDQADLQADASIVLVAIPTTAGTGAEVTNNAVLDVSNSKASLRGLRLFPSFALVDPALLSSAPKAVAIGAGLDAVTQTIEAYTSRLSSPFTEAITEPNIRLGAWAVRKVVERGDQDSWTQMGWVSLSSGLALSNGGLGAAHGLAAVLGSRLKAPHGLLCGRLLGPVLIQNRSVAQIGSETLRKIESSIEALAETFSEPLGKNELSGFEAWLNRNRVPRLRDYSTDKADFDEIAEAAVFASSSTKNAVPLRKADFREILDAAY
ncbi:iron-containing alcohol dehydrogenase [Ruegeria sp. MALMAid1280]|uniref:iron-containing alcohol dehydrogenase n=1 Tax=Ruegeria sp. MALMAid1280 TaxID=3411634 RepID=UPI003BA335F4